MAKKRNKSLKGRITRSYENAKEEIEDAKEKADKYIGKHPMQSIAVAAGVGAIVAIGVTALLLKPRKRSFLDRILDTF